MDQQWTKAELEDWCRGWCRTPHTTLKAFIDAGFCSDQESSREEMRLLPQPVLSTGDAADSLRKAGDLIRDRLLAFVSVLALTTDCASDVDAIKAWDALLGRKATGRLDFALRGQDAGDTTKPVITRPAEPAVGDQPVWYRGWECGFNTEAAHWGWDAWEACLGGADLDCVSITARTWAELLDEIDDHEKTENAA